METWTLVMTLANKLGAASFATLLVIILYGNWKGIWRWGKDYIELETRMRGEFELERVTFRERLKASEEREAWWKEIGMRGLEVGRRNAESLLKVAGQVSDANRNILP